MYIQNAPVCAAPAAAGSIYTYIHTYMYIYTHIYTECTCLRSARRRWFIASTARPKMNTHIYIYIHTYTYIYIYIYMNALYTSICIYTDK